MDWSRLIEPTSHLVESIKKYGVLSPVLCIHTTENRYIVDGQQRYTIAKDIGLSHIPYIDLTPPIDTATLVLALHKPQIDTSAMLKLRFIRAFNWTLDAAHCQALTLPYYAHLKADIARILTLSQDAQAFIHTKRFSFKEILNIIHYNVSVIDEVLHYNWAFNFTKTQFDTVISYIIALIKRNKTSFKSIFDQTNGPTIIETDTPPQYRLKCWLTRLREMAFPIHTQVRSDIDARIAAIHMDTHIQYDPSLEKSGITLNAHITHPDQLRQFTQKMCDNTVHDTLCEIINRL